MWLLHICMLSPNKTLSPLCIRAVFYCKCFMCLCVCIFFCAHSSPPPHFVAATPSTVTGIHQGLIYSTKYWENLWSIVSMGLVLKGRQLLTKSGCLLSYFSLTLSLSLMCVRVCVFLSDRWRVWYVWEDKKENTLLPPHSTFV